MKNQTDITLLKNEQPSEQAWSVAQEFARAWNETHQHQFQDIMSFMLKVSFTDSTTPECEDLLKKLAQLESESKIKFHTYSEEVYEPADYGADGFINIIGISLDGREDRPFVVNESEVLESLDPCPRCHWHDTFDCRQTGPFVIDETLLDQPLADGSPPPAGGWDFVNAPAGHEIISRRLAELLRDNKVQGYSLEKVISQQTGNESERMFQLISEKAILIPCPQHTRIDGQGFCPICGTAWGNLEGTYCVRADVIGSAEIFSRHRNKGAMLYVSHRVYKLCSEANIQRIIPGEVVKICRH